MNLILNLIVVCCVCVCITLSGVRSLAQVAHKTLCYTRIRNSLCVRRFFSLSLLSFVGSFLFFTFTSFQLSDATICAIFASYISSVLLGFLSLPVSSGFFLNAKRRNFMKELNGPMIVMMNK